jgi:hypothetical protein
MAGNEKSGSNIPSADVVEGIMSDILRLAKVAEFPFQDMALPEMSPEDLLETVKLRGDVVEYLASGRIEESFVSLVEQREDIMPEEIGTCIGIIPETDVLMRLLVRLKQDYTISAERDNVPGMQKFYVTYSLLEALARERYPEKSFMVLSGFRVYETSHGDNT